MANLGLQNQNPGNLRDPKTGNFRVFNSPDEGYRALIEDLDYKASGKSVHVKPGQSILEFAKAWAPASDNNIPENWAKNVARTVGKDINAPWDSVPRDLYAEGIKVAEGTTALGKGKVLGAQTSIPLMKEATIAQPAQGMSILAQKIKAKYPQYKDVPDQELEQKILAKYPQYAPLASRTPFQSSRAPQTPQQEYNSAITQGGAAGAISRGAQDNVVEDRSLAGKLGGDLNYIIGSTDESKQATPTGFSAIYKGGSKMFKDGEVGSGLADIGRGSLNVLGGIGAGVGDLIGAGISFVVPDAWEDSMGRGMSKIIEQPHVKDFLVKANEWAKENPKSGNAAGDIFNIATTLIPVARGLGAGKDLMVGGLASSMGRSQAGRQIINSAKKEGIDAFSAATKVIDEVPESFWQKAGNATMGRSPRYYTDTLLGYADDSLAKAQTALKDVLIQEKRTANISGIADEALSFAKNNFEGTGNVVKDLQKAFGSALDKSQDIPLATLVKYMESPNANQYVSQAIEQALKKSGSKAILASQKKAMEAMIAKRVFETLSGHVDSSLSGMAGTAGSMMGGRTGGAIAEALASRLTGNKKGLVRKSLIKNATRGRASLRLAKHMALPALANSMNSRQQEESANPK